ncbi:MAG: hypothetical protein ABIZ80_20600, partial [Bryobacteraceae bacterium]
AGDRGYSPLLPWPRAPSGRAGARPVPQALVDAEVRVIRASAIRLTTLIAASVCHVPLASKTGRTLRFDPKSETVGGQEGNKLLGRQYRKHWSTPKSA